MRLRHVLPVIALLVAACGSEAPKGSPTEAPPSTGQATPVDVERAPVDTDAPRGALAAGFNEAGFDLLRRQPVDANVVFSPSSIGNAMLMARAAADPDTAAAIDAAFQLPDDSHEAWNALEQQLAAAQGDDVTVTIADRIWPRVDAQPDADWLDLLGTHHGAGIEPLDLAGDPEGSRDRINGWVGDRTEGLIPELLPEGFINDGTVLVLTDALYFKAAWKTPFGKHSPVDGTFTPLNGTALDVEFLRELELNDPRGNGDGFVGAEIPYVGDEFSMLVIVPDEGRFADVRDRLDQDLLDEIDATFTTGPYELLMPEWETTTQLDLLDWLKEMGAAPGSYPAISPAAFLDGAVHGADIAVDEWGTVAAAATGLGFEESGPPEPELVVAADKPFLYVIRHRDSGLALFAGQVTDPTT